jgi:hypothetical protein
MEQLLQIMTINMEHYVLWNFLICMFEKQLKSFTISLTVRDVHAMKLLFSYFMPYALHTVRAINNTLFLCANYLGCLFKRNGFHGIEGDGLNVLTKINIFQLITCNSLYLVQVEALSNISTCIWCKWIVWLFLSTCCAWNILLCFKLHCVAQ